MRTDTTGPAVIAYSIPDAARATGYSESTIKRAIARGDLATTTPAGVTKPVILASELRDWLGDPAGAA